MWSGSSNSLCTIWIFFETAIISVVSLNANGQLWTKDPYFDGRLVNFSFYNLGQNDLLSATTGSACAARCLQKRWCRSFFYQPSSAACRLHSDMFSSAALIVADEGVRYFKRDAEDIPDWSCPSWLGYVQEKYSGICYKVYTFSADFLTARDRCRADGAALITLDKDEKVQGIIAALMNTSAFHNQWFHSGASRPADEWGAPWVASSNFFRWETTGQTMAHTYFLPGQPEYADNQNCIDFRPNPQYYTSFTQFSTFADGHCLFQCYFICEIYA